MKTVNHTEDDDDDYDDDDDDEDEEDFDEDEETGGRKKSSGGGCSSAPAGTFMTANDIHNNLAAPEEECWGCDHSFRPQRQPGLNLKYDEIWNLYQSNRATMTDEKLAKIIADYFEKEIFIPIREGEQKSMFWSYEQVLRHIRHHMQDKESIISSTVNQLHEITTAMADTLMFKQGSNAFVHEKHTRNYAALIKAKLQYLDRLDRGGGS